MRERKGEPARGTEGKKRRRGEVCWNAPGQAEADTTQMTTVRRESLAQLRAGEPHSTPPSLAPG